MKLKDITVTQFIMTILVIAVLAYVAYSYTRAKNEARREVDDYQNCILYETYC